MLLATYAKGPLLSEIKTSACYNFRDFFQILEAFFHENTE